jgi:hypothetical protein
MRNATPQILPPVEQGPKGKCRPEYSYPLLELRQGLIDEAIELLSQGAHRWGSEQQCGQKIEVELLGESGDHSGTRKGIATELEEVGVSGRRPLSQHLPYDRSDQFLQLTKRRFFCGAQLIGRVTQSLFAAGRDHNPVVALSEQSSRRQADAAGGSGDQGHPR